MNVKQARRELVFARAEGRCQCEGACSEHEGRCERSITMEAFHVSHLRSRAHGGSDHESNLEAWCSRCNLVLQSRDARDTRIAPRAWQLRELDKIVQQISETGAATLSAAPGAGKTVFAGLVFEALRDAGIVERLMVVVPRAGLCEQWAEALAATRHIELKPHSATWREGQQGVVVTYQSLPHRDRLEAHMQMAGQVPTLLVLDEVHHLSRDLDGTHRAWAGAVAELAGDVEGGKLNVAGILNLSGTLWRSDKGERISTVRYTPPDGEGKIVSLVDGEATTEELIAAGQLRSIDFYRVDAQVQLEDYQELQVVKGNLSDLSESADEKKAARAALAHLASINSWRSAFVSSILDKLEWAHRATDHHVKALIVAARQEQAIAFASEVNYQMRDRGLQPLAELAISDDPKSQRRLESFRERKQVGVLCTVDMAGEGYDCPEIAILGYASNKLTPLYVRQVAARAMRVTERERALEHTLPAIVVLPDSTALVEEFLAYLAAYTDEILGVEEKKGREELEGQAGGPRLRRFRLTDAHAGAETVSVSFLDGSHVDIDSRYASELADHLAAANIPEVFRPRTVAVFQRTVGDLLQRRPFDTFEDESERVVVSEPTIEQGAAMLQAKLAELGRWWAVNGDTPVAHFNHEVNQAAEIEDGKRGTASVDQLGQALRFARERIADYQKENRR